MKFQIPGSAGSKIANTFFMPVFLFLVFNFFISCSSAPKRPVEIFTDRNMAVNQLDLANSTANKGRYTDALLILEDARRLAVSADDPPLLIKTSIARGNILFSLGYHDEAFLHWEAARLEGDDSGEKDLAILAQIYEAKGRLALLVNSGEKTGLENLRDRVNGLISAIKNDVRAQAEGCLVLGMTEKELKLYADAERSVRRAADIHEKNRYLEEAAYDWYFIASIRSVSGRYDDALAALRTALEFDRRAENGFGLASTWQAMGEVYTRKNLTEEANMAFRRAGDIFSAIGLDDLALKAEARIINTK